MNILKCLTTTDVKRPWQGTALAILTFLEATILCGGVSIAHFFDCEILGKFIEFKNLADTSLLTILLLWFFTIVGCLRILDKKTTAVIIACFAHAAVPLILPLQDTFITSYFFFLYKSIILYCGLFCLFSPAYKFEK